MTFSNVADKFLIFVGEDEATSDPNVVGHTRYCSYPGDVLVQFCTPITSASVNSDIDSTDPGADLVRFIVLKSIGPGAFDFMVVAIAEGLDNEKTPEASLLLVTSLSAFDAVVFQNTTEYDAFDNLTFCLGCKLPQSKPKNKLRQR